MNVLVIGVGHWAGLFIWSGAKLPSGFQNITRHNKHTCLTVVGDKTSGAS